MPHVVDKTRWNILWGEFVLPLNKTCYMPFILRVNRNTTGKYVELFDRVVAVRSRCSHPIWYLINVSRRWHTAVSLKKFPNQPECFLRGAFFFFFHSLFGMNHKENKHSTVEMLAKHTCACHIQCAEGGARWNITMCWESKLRRRNLQENAWRWCFYLCVSTRCLNTFLCAS